ncbi:MAG TPA: hypothetical protein PK431_07710 [Chitinophagales bacterium]|nr:hypothetical protein [Chitinophagales bacterium]
MYKITGIIERSKTSAEVQYQLIRSYYSNFGVMVYQLKLNNSIDNFEVNNTAMFSKFDDGWRISDETYKNLKHDKSSKSFSKEEYTETADAKVEEVDVDAVGE